jgi:hypothetical protein
MIVIYFLARKVISGCISTSIERFLTVEAMTEIVEQLLASILPLIVALRSVTKLEVRKGGIKAQ